MGIALSLESERVPVPVPVPDILSNDDERPPLLIFHNSGCDGAWSVVIVEAVELQINHTI